MIVLLTLIRVFFLNVGPFVLHSPLLLLPERTCGFDIVVSASRVGFTVNQIYTSLDRGTDMNRDLAITLRVCSVLFV